MPLITQLLQRRQAMFESLDNTPTLKSQPTSLIFSLDADGKDLRALIGDGFIFLCCEDLGEDFHKFSQYFTGQKLKKYVIRRKFHAC